jgi:hypothetical protein
MSTSGFKIVVEHEISRERVGDLLCCAFEGGSNYWYRIEQFHEPTTYQFRTNKNQIFKHLDYPLNPEGYLVVSDYHGIDQDETPKRRRLSYVTIKRGLKLLSTSKTYAHHWQDFLAENEDATTGDVFLQFCLFGDVIYG